MAVFTFCTLGLVACDKDALNKNYAPKPTAGETELASQLDEKFFKQIETAMDEIEVNKIWPGYNFKRTPMYLIRATHTPSGDLKDAESAYIINPYANISSTHTLGKNEAGSLHIVKYEEGMQVAADKLKSDGANSRFIFHYPIQGKKYYLQTFEKSAVEIDNVLYSSDAGFAVHEAFHNYQSVHFKENPTAEQLNPMDSAQLAKYPLNLATLTTQVYLLDMFKGYPDSPGNTSKATALSVLEKYVAVVESILEADKPMEHKSSLIYRHGLNQERGEGTAKYVDALVERKLLPIYKNKKFIDNVPLAMDTPHNNINLATKLRNRNDVINYFAFESFYGSGASIVFLLNKTGYDFKKIEQGTIPYQAAFDVVKLDEMARKDLLRDIMASDEWHEAQVAARRYEKLLSIN